ncbi:MAG TPA: hypothetical protein VGH73_16475, partial [Thermoanaerobaculia bacterium]
IAKLLFAAALAATAFLAAPPKASASGPAWACNQCDATGACVPCCVCAGGTISHCSILCSQ